MPFRFAGRYFFSIFAAESLKTLDYEKKYFIPVDDDGCVLHAGTEHP